MRGGRKRGVEEERRRKGVALTCAIHVARISSNHLPATSGSLAPTCRGKRENKEEGGERGGRSTLGSVDDSGMVKGRILVGCCAAWNQPRGREHSNREA